MITDNSAWERFILICKPEQSGKTFIMIKMINEDLTDDIDKEKKVVNFIFCDNSLLLTKQTASRVASDVKKLPDIDEHYVEFSSRSKKSARDIIIDICFQDITNVICCTNKTRVENLIQIIDLINKKHPDDYIFKIWLDEADKFQQYIGKKFLPLAQTNKNVHCYLITATPDPIFKKYEYIKVLPIENTTSEHYHGWLDNNIQIRENDYAGPEVYVMQIVNEVKDANEGIVPQGTKWYIPANHKKISHSCMSSMLVGNGFAVFVVNGDGLRLSLPDRTSVIFPKTKELQEQVRKLYKDYNLSQYPVAITGHVCIGRGISIMQPKNDTYDEFIFDYGILSNCSNKEEASQNAGRCKGCCKNWDGYKPPTIFCTPYFNEIATRLETCSRKLGQIAFSQNPVEPSVVTKDEFKGIGKDYKHICHPVLFETMKAVREFLATKKEDMGVLTSPKPRCCDKQLRTQCGGYAVTTRWTRGDKKKKDLTSEDRLTLDEANNLVGVGVGISSTKVGQRCLVLPVYESRSTPPTQEKFQVRYLKKL